MYRVLTQSYGSEQQKVPKIQGCAANAKKRRRGNARGGAERKQPADYSGSSATFSRFSTASTIESHAAGFGFKIS